jgi:hypothetical protein
MRRRRWIVGLGVVLLVALPLALLAQRGRGNPFGFGAPRYDNVRYDGRFAFARIQYAGYVGWAFDYPDMERHLTTILRELTSIRPHTDASNIHTFDDPELFKFPVAYLSEPGYWYPSEEEVLGLRTYLQKGAFLIVDDFHFPNEWAVFERAMRRVLPDARIERLTISHPIFNCFFAIKTLQVPYPGGLGEQGLMGEFFGIYEDNDPDKRLMVVINYNMDIGDYMEWSHTGIYSIAPTNEAYKFGINYVIYGLTH